MYDRFTERARRVLVLAQEEARLLGHGFIGTEHILLGLIQEGEGVAARALESLGITLEAVRAKVEETIGMAGSAPNGSPPFTPRAKKVLELSLREAKQLGHTYIGTEHMLLGIVREGQGAAAQVLVSLGADLGRVRQAVIQFMSGETEAIQHSRPAAAFGTYSDPAELAKRGRPVIPPVSSCALCGVDLWEAAHFVTGSHVPVCDHCVRTAARLLEVAAPEHRRLVLPPRVSGEIPDEEAPSAIVDAVQLAFCASTGPESLSQVVEEFENVEAYFRRTQRLAPQRDATRLNRLRFLTPELAEVRFEITRADSNASSFEGRVHWRDGRWMVTVDTVAMVLAPRGSGAPPRKSESVQLLRQGHASIARGRRKRRRRPGLLAGWDTWFGNRRANLRRRWLRLPTPKTSPGAPQS